MLRDAEWVIEEVGQMRPGEGIGGEDKPPRHVWAYMGDHPDCPTAKVWHDMGRDLATESAYECARLVTALLKGEVKDLMRKGGLVEQIRQQIRRVCDFDEEIDEKPAKRGRMDRIAQ
eukprot:6777450-Prorocentrum_lima.AAC.1